MNRRERRNLGKKQKQPTYNMTQWQVQDIAMKTIQDEITKAKKEVLEYTTKTLMAAFCFTLHELEGYGLKRLKRVMEAVDDTFKAVYKDEFKIEELHRKCEELGLKIGE